MILIVIVYVSVFSMKVSEMIEFKTKSRAIDKSNARNTCNAQMFVTNTNYRNVCAGYYNNLILI